MDQMLDSIVQEFDKVKHASEHIYDTLMQGKDKLTVDHML